MFGGPQLFFSTGWTDASELTAGALDVLCSREHVWWTSTRLQHRLNRCFRINHRCIGCTMFQKACLSWSVNIFSTGWTDAPTDHAPVQWCKPGYCVRTPNGYYLDTERPVEPMPSISHPSVLPMVTIFLQWTSNGYVTLSTLYKGTPTLFELPLTPWIPEATLEKKRKCFEQKSEDLVHWLCFNLEEFNLCKCSKCVWTRASWV